MTDERISAARLADSMATCPSDAERLAELAIKHHVNLARYIPFKVIKGKTLQVASQRDPFFTEQTIGFDRVELTDLAHTFTVDYHVWRLDRLNWHLAWYWIGYRSTREAYVPYRSAEHVPRLDQATYIYTRIGHGMPLPDVDWHNKQYIVFFEYTGPR